MCIYRYICNNLNWLSRCLPSTVPDPTTMSLWLSMFFTSFFGFNSWQTCQNDERIGQKESHTAPSQLVTCCSVNPPDEHLESKTQGQSMQSNQRQKTQESKKACTKSNIFRYSHISYIIYHCIPHHISISHSRHQVANLSIWNTKLKAGCWRSTCDRHQGHLSGT